MADENISSASEIEPANFQAGDRSFLGGRGSGKYYADYTKLIDRANHTGNVPAANVSGLDTAISSNATVTGNTTAASNAQSTADAAVTSAGNAQSDATQALSDASDAQTDATQALSDAAAAQSDATLAKNKTDQITITGPFDADATKTKLNLITVTSLTDLDNIRTNAVLSFSNIGGGGIQLVKQITSNSIEVRRIASLSSAIVIGQNGDLIELNLTQSNIFLDNISEGVTYKRTTAAQRDFLNRSMITQTISDGSGSEFFNLNSGHHLELTLTGSVTFNFQNTSSNVNAEGTIKLINTNGLTLTLNTGGGITFKKPDSSGVLQTNNIETLEAGATTEMLLAFKVINSTEIIYQIA